MKYIEKYAGVVALVIAITITVQINDIKTQIGILAGMSGASSNVGGGTRFPNGLSADSTSPSAGQVRGTTFLSTGVITTDGGTLRSSTNATSVPASMTMKASDIAGYDVVLVSPTEAAAAKTLTFFASSSASTWLPTAGDMQETCFVNATSTAATTLVFAAGTGIDLETASSSPTDLTILAGNTACFKFIRQPATASAFDITAAMTEYTNGD